MDSLPYCCRELTGGPLQERLACYDREQKTENTIVGEAKARQRTLLHPGQLKKRAALGGGDSNSRH